MARGSPGPRRSRGFPPHSQANSGQTRERGWGCAPSTRRMQGKLWALSWQRPAVAPPLLSAHPVPPDLWREIYPAGGQRPRRKVPLPSEQKSRRRGDPRWQGRAAWWRGLFQCPGQAVPMWPETARRLPQTRREGIWTLVARGPLPAVPWAGVSLWPEVRGRAFAPSPSRHGQDRATFLFPSSKCDPLPVPARMRERGARWLAPHPQGVAAGEWA